MVLEHVVRHTLVGASRETEILAHLPPSDRGKGITHTSWIRVAAFKASSEAAVVAGLPLIKRWGWVVSTM